jgi:hypothetical protein
LEGRDGSTEEAFGDGVEDVGLRGDGKRMEIEETWLTGDRTSR